MFGVLGTVLGLQFLGSLALALLIYQVTPHSILAQQTFIGRIPTVLSLVRIADRLGNPLYWGATPPEALPSYQLVVNPSDLEQINKELPTEPPSPWYGNLFLTEDGKNWVPATFVADGKTYEVEVRVRGDLFNHWAYRKKSWRVKFDKDDLFQGKREINLLIPEDRGWFAEPLNAYRAKKFSLLHPPMQFVTVSLNGSEPLLYTEIEHWSKEMLEKLGRPGDANLYQTGGGASYFQQWDAVFEDIAYWDKYTVDPSRADSYEQIEELMKLSEQGAHSQPGYMARLTKLVDTDRLIAWYAHSLLAGSRHVRDHNVRLYFDPSRGRFEPIPWDTGLYAPRSILSPPGNPLLNEVFSSPELKLAAHRFVWEYINDDEQVQDDFNQAAHMRALIERVAYRDSLKLPSNRQVKRELDQRTNLVNDNILFLKEELSRSEVLQTQRIPTLQEQETGNKLTIDMTVRGPVASVLSELKFPEEFAESLQAGAFALWRDTGNGIFDGSDLWVPLQLQEEKTSKGNWMLKTTNEMSALLWPGDAEIGAGEEVVNAPHTRHRFFLVQTGAAPSLEPILPLNIEIDNAVTGEKVDVIGDVLLDMRTFEHINDAYISRAEFLRRYTNFDAYGDNDLILKRGTVVRETIIIPSTIGRVHVELGTITAMRKGASILSYAPVSLLGEEGRRIIFRPERAGEPWGVFAVLNVKEPSEVRWAEFSGGGDAFINGTFFSGMVAFHGSPVSVSHSTFSGATGDDGLNLKYIYVDVKQSAFIENSFDGLDVDVAQAGTVEDSTFINNGNDGLDISWSPIIIRNVTVQESGDKCISVGERSAPLIQDSTLQGCNNGIAVKDGSQAVVERTIFAENEIAIAAYIKKSIFTAPSVSVSSSVFNENKEKTLALSGAVIVIDPQ